MKEYIIKTRIINVRNAMVGFQDLYAVVELEPYY